jgi:hypothetical protein
MVSLFILISGGVRAESLFEAPLSGRAFSDFYFPLSSSPDGQWQQISASVWLETNPRLGDHFFGQVIGTANGIATSSVPEVGQTLKFDIREGFAGYTNSGWEFRAGKMIVPWGKSDAINPTDFLTAKDYTFFNPDEEVRRIGAISFWTSWTPDEGNSPWGIQLIFTPNFPESKVLIAPNQIPPSFTILPVSRPAQWEAAVKASYSGTNWDGEILVYKGWNHLPVFQVASATLISPTQVQSQLATTFQRYTALGLNTSITEGKWVFRGESAYVWTENNDGQNPLIQPTHLDVVAGAERPISDDLRVQAQGLVRYYPRYLSPNELQGTGSLLGQLDQQVAQVNALIQNYQDQVRPAFTFRLAYSHDPSGIASELFLLTNFIGGDYLVRPQFSYLWTDSLKTILGMDYYAGPKDRPLGVLSVYSSIYSELRYVF